MKITFTQDHQSPQSGNEYYKAGAQADLPRGAALIALGVAREGWAPVVIPVIVPEPVTEQAPDYNSMTVVQLIDEAKARGVSYAGLRKADLVSALEDAD